MPTPCRSRSRSSARVTRTSSSNCTWEFRYEIQNHYGSDPVPTFRYSCSVWSALNCRAHSRCHRFSRRSSIGLSKSPPSSSSPSTHTSTSKRHTVKVCTSCKIIIFCKVRHDFSDGWHGSSQPADERLHLDGRAGGTSRAFAVVAWVWFSLKNKKRRI